METTSATHNVIEKSIRFIASRQRRDGSFPSLTSRRQNDFAGALPYKTTFITSQVLGCLNQFAANSKNEAVDSMRRKAASFLMSQKSDVWSFNYWQRGSVESSQMPYPDDLDDTFSALSALWSYDQKLINGKALHNVAGLLIATEAKVGGPYQTWLVPKSAPRQWHDVDVAVNANIAYFLFLQKVSLPGLSRFFDAAIVSDKLSSIYYPNFYPCAYFLSRLYGGAHKQRLISLLLSKRKKDVSWGNSLDTALCVLALINLGYAAGELEGSIKYILKKFNGKGWPAFAFCLDPSKNGQKHYAGSEALTAAFCLQALSQYQTCSGGRVVAKHQDRMQLDMCRKITLSLQKKFVSFGPEFKAARVLALEKIKKDESIILLPLHFKRTLAAVGKNISNKLIVSLGQINACGWIAYTVYDDFLDGDGDSKLLSLANICLREVAVGYKEILSKNPAGYSCVKKTLDEIDQANAWEVNHCGIIVNKGKFAVPKSLPDYGDLTQLAKKSLGHALGPVSILLLSGFAKDSPEVKNLIKYFTHYIIARQLNDDAHDWLDDLKIGRLTYVNSLVLKKASRRNINLKADTRYLQGIFWRRVMPQVAKDIFSHTAQARTKLKRISAINDPAILSALLEPPEMAAKQALSESRKAREFVAAANSV